MRVGATCASAHSTSTGARAVDEQQRLRHRAVGQRFDARARRRDHDPVRAHDVLLHDDRGVVEPASRLDGRDDARHRRRGFQPLPGARLRLLLHPGPFPGALQRLQGVLDLLQQIRFLDGPDLAPHAQVLRRDRRRGVEHAGEPHGRHHPPSAHVRQDSHGADALSAVRSAGALTSGPVKPEPGQVGQGHGAAADPLARYEPDLRVTAVVAVRVIGVQEVMPRRNRPARQRLQRAPVQGQAFRAAHIPVPDPHATVRVHLDPLARHAGDGLEVQRRRAQGLGRLEDHEVALRGRARRQQQVAPGVVRPRAVDMNPRRRQQRQCPEGGERAQEPGVSCPAGGRHGPSPASADAGSSRTTMPGAAVPGLISRRISPV